MKFFKPLVLLTLAAALSCSANGSPTNVTTDGYPTQPSKQVLTDVINSLQGIARLYFEQYGAGASFTKEYVNRLAWVRPYNYIVCLVDHDYGFDGIEGQDWAHGEVYYRDPGDNSENNKIWYDVVVGQKGWFRRNKKGGYENWAWNGYVVWGQNIHSNYINFIKAPTTGNAKASEGGGD